MKLLIRAPFIESERKRLETYFDEIVYDPWTTTGERYYEDEMLEVLKKEQPDALIDVYKRQTYTLKNGTKAANYNIKKVEGKLTITAAAPVTPPNTSNTPANPTPQNRNVVQRVVTSVRNVPSRIARAVQETGAKVRELVNAGDNNVPLGNQKLDDHTCCVLHFLIMLLTAILYGFFTHNLKKRQKKLFEVREELDTELAKMCIRDRQGRLSERVW